MGQSAPRRSAHTAPQRRRAVKSSARRAYAGVRRIQFTQHQAGVRPDAALPRERPRDELPGLDPMLETLTERLSRVVKTLRGEARLTEANIQDALREVRLALLEADVALPVVKDFIARVRDKALGEEVVGSLTPGPGAGRRRASRADRADGRQRARPLDLATQPPAVILMAGLQGAGKTTTAAKLAQLLRGREEEGAAWSRPTSTGRRRSSS